ncbi:MAG: S24 family peptidase [Pseudomonadota bacterium]
MPAMMRYSHDHVNSKDAIKAISPDCEIRNKLPVQAITKEWLREKVSQKRGLQAELARHLGIAPEKISKVLSGDRRLTAEELPRVLEFFGEDTYTRTIPVTGYAGAGAEIYSIDDHEKGGGIEEVPAPPGAGPSAVGVIVRGDSMWPVYRDGDILVYDEKMDDPTQLLERECVCALTDGRYFVKILKQGPGDTFRLCSHNAPDIEDVFLLWAARIRFVIKA